MHTLLFPASRTARRAAAFAGLLSALVFVLPGTAYADPEDELSLEELNERAEELETEYNGELRQYTDARETAEEAEARLTEVDEQLAQARDSVGRFAATQYQGTGLDPAIELALSSSPENMLQDAAVLGQLSHSNSSRVLALTELREEREQASEEADAALAEARELVGDLEEQRDEILARIERYEREQVPEPAAGAGNGTVPESAKGWGFDGATPRMAAIRDEIIMTFGAPYEVGCLRPGDPGEHGSGRACDFMMSAAGASPSSANQELGDQIAEYARANADRLGVMYVIWEQRIWDSRNPGAGWRQMEDRGSITQNHYDHVHVSSF
ncbi:coiled-coil domain-containing protein [Marinactinospora rubrisoli]|uniref:Coiled-coil domain-containing protein n=1 Tax=Marinactinospora rubrisoli TaxID=2715399 RepID=A0ABW2KEG4_9ACTN